MIVIISITFLISLQNLIQSSISTNRNHVGQLLHAILLAANKKLDDRDWYFPN